VAFAAGTPVALREIWRGRVWKARPVVAVRDDDELVALWTPDGASMRIADTGSGVPADNWRLVPFAAERDALRLSRPGARVMHAAVWHDGVFAGWKVDVIRPLRRFCVGFEYLDLELDVSVGRDGEAAIVDEDEFVESCRQGVIDAREAAAVRREAEGALRAARRRKAPFGGEWERWRPNPAWPVPGLPERWDEPAEDLPRLR
jgi:uncharacterized protein